MRSFLALALAAASFPAAYGQASAPRKIQVLILTGQDVHDWRSTAPVLRKVLEDTGRFEVRITEEFRGAGPETLAPYDAVVLHYMDRRQPALRWGGRAEQALLDYAKSGKGVVMYHFSSAAFVDWPEYEKLCGGNWRPNQGHHSARHDFTVEIKDTGHPITKGMKKSFLQPNDELYANLKWQPEGTYHVLATAYDDHSLYGGKARQPIPGPGLHHPMLWTLQYGKGRVFATALGHDVPAIQTPGFIGTFVRGVEWSATGNVTIPLPKEIAE